jgi:hypothetical protein
MAFLGVLPLASLPKLIFAQIALKTLYEIVVLPVTIQVVRKLKQIEQTDVYDEGISYNVLKIKDL